VVASPDDAEGHYLLARARRMAADAVGAEASFRRALELSPSYTDAMIGLGGILLDAGKFEDADTLYQTLVTRGSALHGRLGRVEALIGLGRLADARVQLEGLPEASRSTPGARAASARLALAEGSPGEALAVLREVVEAEPRKASLHALYGDALYAADQVDAASGAYETALEIDSGLPEALLGRAQVSLRAERVDAALETLDQVAESLTKRLRGPALRAAFLVLGGQAHLMRARSGDRDKAIEALREAVQLRGERADAHFWLGEALAGRPGAADAYRRYLELDPERQFAARARKALGPLQ